MPNERRPAGSPGSPHGAVIQLLVALVALVGLVWELQPERLKLVPAPLRPQEEACQKVRTEFTPTNFTELPGVELASLSKEQRNHLLLRLNLEPCPCGCNTSIAYCLVNHPHCQQSKEVTQKMIAEETRP